MKAIVNGKLWCWNKTIEKCTILIQDGKIQKAGADVAVPQGAEIIDAANKWVTPGFIDAHTHISTFNEPQTMPGMYDGNEVSSPNTAQIRGIDALNPNDIAIGITRSAGFTTCYTGPGSANVIGGTGISFKTKQGKTVFDIAIPGTEQMKFALGENPRRVYGSDKKLPTTRMGIGAVMREALFNARAYSDKLIKAQNDPDKLPAPDFKLEALVPVVRGEMKARIHCHRSDDIVTAVRIAEEFGLDYSIEHCTEGYMITDFLKEKNVTAVIGPLAMGFSKMEIWNRTMKAPGWLEKAGIDNFCLTEDTGSNTKYLPTHIGLCIARGLSENMALKAVTENPAKLLGLGHRVGAVEPGMDADLAIWSGFPFSNLSICEKTVIEGEVYENPVW